MALIGWVIFGIAAGTLANWLTPHEDPGCLTANILLGTGGAVLGGFIGRALWGGSGVNNWDGASFGVAVAGAVVLLALYRITVGRGSTAGV